MGQKKKRRCSHCRKNFLIDLDYLKDKRGKGQKHFYCSRTCSAHALSKLGILQASNKKRAKHPKKPNKKQVRSKEDRKWAKDVLKRDGYICQHCGATSQLQAHHIAPFAKVPAKRLDLSNGITLCATCHSKQHPELPRWLFFRRYVKDDERCKLKAPQR